MNVSTLYMFYLLYVYFLFVVDGTHCHNYASEFKHSQNVTQKQVEEIYMYMYIS